MYPQKIFDSILDEYSKVFVRYTAECEYQLDFRSKDKDKPLGVATINHPTQVRNRNKIRKLEKDGYKFYKIDKLTIKNITLSGNLIQFFIKIRTKTNAYD